MRRGGGEECRKAGLHVHPSSFTIGVTKPLGLRNQGRSASAVCCVTLGKSSHLSELPVSHLKMFSSFKVLIHRMRITAVWWGYLEAR